MRLVGAPEVVVRMPLLLQGMMQGLLGAMIAIWALIGGFTLVGPISPDATRGNSSEGVDVWGPGSGSGTQPPPGRTPIVPVK